MPDMQNTNTWSMTLSQRKKVQLRIWQRWTDINSWIKMYSSVTHTAQPRTPFSSTLSLDSKRAGEVEQRCCTRWPSSTSHICRVGRASFPSGSAPQPDLLWGTWTDTCCIFGDRVWGVHRAEQSRHIPSVALYADGLVKRSYTSSRSLSVCVSPSRGERSWSAGVWTCTPGQRTVSPLWGHIASPWPPHPA